MDYLFSGKELEAESGFYYYGARYQNPMLAMFNQEDPLRDMQPWQSSHAYCSNNPINRTDPTGMLDDDIYYNEQGKEIYRLVNDKPDRNFVIKTTKTTADLYENVTHKEKGYSSSISTETATSTETEISKGNLSGEHMKNVVQLESPETIQKMIETVSKDDGKGGSSAANNTEYGGFLKTGNVTAAKPGAAGDPSKGKCASITGDVDFHSHPSGTVKVTGGTASWVQPPSKTDIKTAKGNDYIFGMGNGTMYVYNKKGVIATIPMSTFKK